MSPTPKGIAIVGPTTSGKTALALEVARRLEGEIISVDSRQIYRGMDIGTDKVAPSARAEVPHHGLDLCDPDESYSAGRFARDARRRIEAVEARGRVPLLVGGTGFFLRTLTHPIFEEPPIVEARRAKLREWLLRQPRQHLARWVERLDPERARVAREGGVHRLARSLEIPLLTGRSLSWWYDRNPTEGRPVSLLIVHLDVSREELDRRIDARVDRMVGEGLVEEVEALLDAGYTPDAPGMTGTGYREIVRVVRGECDLEEALDEMRAQTRRYARRQITWFRHQLPGDTLVLKGDRPASDPDALEMRVEAILGEWYTRRGARR